MCLRYTEWWEETEAKKQDRKKKKPLKIRQVLSKKTSDTDKDLLGNIQIAYSSW